MALNISIKNESIYYSIEFNEKRLIYNCKALIKLSSKEMNFEDR